MSATPQVRSLTTPGRAAPGQAALARTDQPVVARRLVARLAHGWLPRLAWWVSRTGRPGLVGLALLVAAAVFFASTHRDVAAEIEALRADLEAAQRPRPASPEAVAKAAAAQALPPRSDMPAILRQLFGLAVQERLAVDTGRYEVKETKSGGVVRYQIVLPVTGPYPRVRAFIDATLQKMPVVALSELALERKAISDFDVDAQIRWTVYAGAGAPSSAGRTPSAGGGPPVAEPARPTAAGAAPGAGAAVPSVRPATDRVVAPTHAAALFAQHSWVVLKPMKLPPPPPPPPPPEPTAPPFPYTFVGSFTPGNDPPVFFLTRGDRVIDAHVGDKLDGVYQLESAAQGQLVFVYLPLNIRQNIPAGVNK
jgi:hypothetical protein